MVMTNPAFDFWYSYLIVDIKTTVNNKHMLKNITEKAKSQ